MWGAGSGLCVQRAPGTLEKKSKGALKESPKGTLKGALKEKIKGSLKGALKKKDSFAGSFKCSWR